MWKTWLFVLLVICKSVYGKDLRIGAFNIQVFGISKASKPEVVEILVKIIRRYDLLLIQEIRDSRNKAIHYLLDRVNEGQSEPFSMILSDRLGRTISKEQYAFLYKPDSGLSVNYHYVYEDVGDLFEREPFIISFSSEFTAMSRFILLGIHVDPDDAVHEIDSLHKVVVDIKKMIPTGNIMIMGDLNADCGYVSRKKMSALELRKDPLFHWWIDDKMDTTVKQTDCAYDRFISTGTGWDLTVVTNSTKVYRFDIDPDIGEMDTTMAARVSDHYPIELVLKGNDFSFYTMSVYDVFIDLLEPTGSLTVGQFYDLLDSGLVLDESGVPRGKLRLEYRTLLHEVLININDRDVVISVEPRKKRYLGKQRCFLHIDVPTIKENTFNRIWNQLYNICEQTKTLRCKSSKTRA